MQTEVSQTTSQHVFRQSNLLPSNETQPTVTAERLKELARDQSDATIETVGCLITMREVLGALAKSAVQQSPYFVPDQLETALTKFREAFKLPYVYDTMQYGYFRTARALEQRIDNAIQQVEEILKWNEPKIPSKKGSVLMVTRYSSVPADHDFIDLDALIRNMRLDVFKSTEKMDLLKLCSDVVIFDEYPKQSAENQQADNSA